MKAPDKIYCENCSDGIYSHIDRWDIADNIVYIRKDALLEWAKELKFHLKNRSGLQYEGAKVVIDGVIEQIESL